MDKRVVAHYGGDLTRANIHPRKRAKVLAKYGATSVSGTTTAAA
jgi:alkane 1-monooxygenase